MKHVELIRLEESSQGTLGAIRIDGRLFCACLELPDRGNAANISRIPPGNYICAKTVSPRFGETYEVLDVPQRSHILFHAGNTDDDTQGCILLGKYWGNLKGERAVLNSGATFRDFLVYMIEEYEFKLTVLEAF